ncbi:MAG: protein kinase domain-containing protein [Gemmatimonadaceae bacterium]
MCENCRRAELRHRFVEEAVKGDNALRDEVLALLRADEAAHPLFDLTPDALAEALRPPATESFVGRRIGVYTLVREIGRGGMATVFHGEDTKHNRAVALKLLAASASSALGGARFRREIDVVARLQHPNVLPLYDSGESEGLLYYVMPLVPGGTLRDRITREGPLPLADVRRITSQIAAGLDYAHRHGVVHRDVKPANVLLDEEHVAIGDFGIAQASSVDAGDRLTTAGVVVGTPAYMSPEHAAGAGELDARSDTYSLACVVFEMLTGAPPFHGPTSAALFTQHLRDPVPSVRAARPELGPAVDDVLRRALAKAPEDRFASARDFSNAFEAALDAPHLTTSQSLSALGRHRWRVAAAAAGLLAAAAALVTVLRPGSEREIPSIAVLPFVNMSGDAANEYFSDGVTEEITGALAQLGRLRVTPRTTAFAYKGRTGDIRRIGDELGVSRILEGSVRRDGERVLFVTSLYNANSGDRLWTNRYERDWGTVLELQAEIAGTIAEQLRLRLRPAERTRIAERHTVNADAYGSYLRGRHFFEIRTAASLQQALPHFQRAVEIDSLYARAFAGLADTYSILAWTGAAAPRDLFPLAERAAQRALALDSTIAETFVSLGIIRTFHTWDWAAGERHLKRALALDSTLTLGWFFDTWHYAARGRLAEALAALRRARELDPLSLITNARIGTVLVWMRRYPEAEAALRETLELDPQYSVAQLQLARVLSLLGRHTEAIAALPPDSLRFGSFESGISGWVLARAGKRNSALAALRQLEARPYVPAEGVAVIHTALGDHDTALTWLERAVAARGVGLMFMAAEPMYEPLHNEPRYRQVIEQVKVIPPA